MEQTETVFQNKFSVAMFNLPILLKPEKAFRKNKPLMNRLSLIKRKMDFLKKAIDYKVRK